MSIVISFINFCKYCHNIVYSDLNIIIFAGKESTTLKENVKSWEKENKTKQLEYSFDSL